MIMIIVHVVFSTAAAVPPASNDVDGVGDASVQEQVVFKGQVQAQAQGLEGSQGWFDPRLFGGRMLDVCHFSLTLPRYILMLNLRWCYLTASTYVA